LEMGMANGRPTVLLRAIYQQAPKYFAKAVELEDTTEVALPFAKVLEQFASFQLRPDQDSAQEVPQVETPFLKVAEEDGKRFGIAAAPVPKPAQTDRRPPVDDKPAAAPTPGPSVEVKAARPIRLPVPEKGNGHEIPAARPPIAAKFSPNGADAPATERVPASSGPSVPTPLPIVGGRIPFKVTPPSNDLRVPLAPKVTLPALKPEAAALAGPQVKLSLRAVLREIPPFQFSGSVEAVPAEARIEFSFAIIQPQLSLGRIAVSPAQFLAALPAELRASIKLDDAETPVALPLQEVLQNLPGESLQLRGDQEEIVIHEEFETPFSKKAAEDADRLKTSARPVSKTAAVAGPTNPDLTPAMPAVAKTPAAVPPAPAKLPVLEARVPAGPAPVKPPLSQPPAPVASAPAKPPVAPAPATAASTPKADGRSALQLVLDTDDELDPKGIVGHISRLPGVKACSVVFSDGLNLAGNIPEEFNIEALCALAPAIMKRIGDQMVGANLGALQGLSIFCSQKPVSFFAHGNICLAALHAEGEMDSATRLRLNSTAQEIARMYAKPA
ncbi:MAG: hypothetical protein H0T83_01915, partial [Chthoniobacterales bacterium]|nr:hypothetical protein [Chthoniobacterales bacterium]